MSTKSDEDAHDSLVYIMFTRSKPETVYTHGRTQPHQRDYIPFTASYEEIIVFNHEQRACFMS